MMSVPSDDRNPVEVLAEEFLARARRGEQPSLAEYVARYPDLAAEIHELFPVLLDMEDARVGGDELPARAAGPTGQLIKRLGDYRILREVGRGGMGVVYEAEQESLGRRVALKVLAGVMSTPQQVRRFEREARSAAKLHHTNIVPVFGVGHEGGAHYYVMQFIPGQPLDEVLKEVGRMRRNRGMPGEMRARPTSLDHGDRPVAADIALTVFCGLLAPIAPAELHQAGRGAPPTATMSEPADVEALPLPAEPIDQTVCSSSSSDVLSASAHLTGLGRPFAHAVARIGVQVADALEYAIEQGIIHRDIKPSNILLDVYGTAWVTDFGLAKVLGQEALTQTGDLVGTLRYMPPERFRGQADRRGDVYALGLTLYEMLALKPAFDESDRARLIHRVTEEEPPRLMSLDPSIPRDLATVVQKAMSREPADRYPTAGGLAADLRRFLDDRPILARRPSLLDRGLKFSKRYRSAVIAGTIGLVLALAILAASLGWIVRDRGARSELTEREVTRALLESTAFQKRAKWSEALEAVKRAQGVLAWGESKQLRRLVDEQRKDLEMVLRLDEIRQPRPVKAIEGGYDRLDWGTDYIAAFRTYGIDVRTLDPAVAGALIRARSIRRELTAGLDHWVDQLKRFRSSDEAIWKRLIAVARAADPDPFRNRLRDALEHGDRLTPNKLAESTQIDDLPMATLELLLPHLDKQHQLPVLRRAQLKHPDDYWINFKLAFGLDYEPPPLQNQDEAIRFYTAAIACRPRNAPAHFYLGHVLEQRGRRDEAIAAYQKAIELDPDFNWPSTNLRLIYLKQGELDLVIAECQRVIERNGKDVEAHAMLAKVFAQLGRTEESIQEYEKTLDLNPNAAEYRNDLAWTLVTCPETRLRNPRRGLELAKSAVELSKKSAPCWNTLGVASYRTGDWKAAIKALEKSIGIQGYSSYDGFFLAMSHEKLGQPEKARTEFDRAVRWTKQVKPKDEELRRFRAEAAELLHLDERSMAVPK
jgi:serine/threonine protein kinase/Tfp pilus assembly protein PilF